MPNQSHNLYAMALSIMVMVSGTFLSGCTILQDSGMAQARYADDEISTHDSSVENPQTKEISDVDADAQTQQQGQPLLYTINDYVRHLTQDLVANMEQMTSQTPLGVTHFAWLDSDLTQSNVMALQMAEGFKHEFHQYRIPVVDFKSTGFIRVTEQGDFYLSRDHEDLNFDVPIDYILTGTFALHHGGVLINARVIDVSNKQIVASAQSLVPAHIANAVMVSYENVIAEHLHLLGLPPQL